MKNNKTYKNFIIILDCSFIALLVFLAVLGLKEKANSKATTYSSNIEISLANNNSPNNQTSNTNPPKTTNPGTVSSDIADNNSLSNDSISDNSASDNNASDTSISNDAVSDNSILDNSTLDDDKIYSYAIKNAPDIMNKPSGTTTNPSNIDTTALEQYFIIMPIPDDIYAYIRGKSFQDNTETTLDDLRYIKVLHYNFDHNIQVGEIIVNKKIANEIRDIFMELYRNEYEIQSMYLPDRYWDGDGNSTDTASCDANNTSGFFYRKAEGSKKLSKHAKGMAIDINPQQNPYVSYTTGSPVCVHDNAQQYIARDTGLPHVITTDDLCYKLFANRGYKWGGSWNNPKDYQHFQK